MCDSCWIALHSIIRQRQITEAPIIRQRQITEAPRASLICFCLMIEWHGNGLISPAWRKQRIYQLCWSASKKKWNANTMSAIKFGIKL